MSPFNTYRLSVKKSSLIKNHKGQAVVEYLLITFVTITLVLGLATKVFPQVNSFVQNYAGTYIRCLLETGELPGTSQTNPNSECTIEGMSAMGQMESPSHSMTGIGGSGSGSSNSNSSQGANNQAGGNSGSGGGSSGNSNRNPQPVSPGSTGADSSSGSGGSSQARGSSNSETGSGNGSERNNSNSGNSIRNPYANLQDNGRGISGQMSYSLPSNVNLAGKKPDIRTGIKKDNTLGGEHLRRGAFSAPVNKAQDRDPNALNTDGLGFSFGMYLRYFLIGGILLALFIMVGTQLNSLRKSWGTN